MEPIFEAVLHGGKTVGRLLRAAPDSCHQRIGRDRWVPSFEHWLYLGDTGLHLAAAGLRVAEAKLLLDAGADPNAENRRRATPLHYSCDPRPQSKNPWSQDSQTAMIALLVEYGADLDRADRGGAAPLHRAVRARSPGAVGRLLTLGARPDCRLGERGSSPLHLAVQSTGAGGTAGSLDRQLAIIALLLRHGGDPDAADATGRTPRDWATSERTGAALGSGVRASTRQRRGQ